MEILAEQSAPLIPRVIAANECNGRAARGLADAYLTAISASWRGDPDGQAFVSWLSQFRSDALPAEADTTPDASSPHGGGGRGIRWHETPEAVLGYIGGTNTGYRVPSTVGTPSARTVATVGAPGRHADDV